MNSEHNYLNLGSGVPKTIDRLGAEHADPYRACKTS